MRRYQLCGMREMLGTKLEVTFYKMFCGLLTLRMFSLVEC